MTDPGEIERLTELMQDLNVARAERREQAERMMLFYGGPLPPLPWHKRVRGEVREFVRRDRERLARFIAPWLGEDW